MENFGNRLREIREKRGLSQRQSVRMIAKIGVTQDCKSDAIGKYERGERFPSAYKLRDICVALNVSADYLLGLSDKEDLK